MLKCQTFGILTFMSRINSMPSKVEHEKSFITSGPEVEHNPSRWIINRVSKQLAWLKTS